MKRRRKGLGLYPIERLREVVQQIVEILQADGDTNHVVGQPYGLTPFGWHRGMGHRRRMTDQRFHTPETFRQRAERNMVQEHTRALERAELERHDAAIATHLPCRER